MRFLGKIGEMSAIGWLFSAAITAAVIWWIIRSISKTTWVGMIGRVISAVTAIFIAFLLGATLLSGNPWGTLMTTLFYVIVGCAL